jgi:proteic killer suppression protein
MATELKPIRTKADYKEALAEVERLWGKDLEPMKDALTEAAFNGEVRKGFPADLIKPARRKLGYLNAAIVLEDLRVPPANRLEALKGDRQGQHSIRVNDQFRICFFWTAEGPKEVEFVDYH